MQPFAFLHCADIHLGAPVGGSTDPPPHLAEALRDAPRDAFVRLVDAAIERRVVAVLIAGDLFHAADRNLRAWIALRDQLERLDAAGISTLIAAGNHDPISGRDSGIEMPSSVHWFDDGAVERVQLRVDGEPVASVYGISYGHAEVRDNLVERFPEDPEGPFAIGVLHANVGDRPEHGRYSPCRLDDLTARRFDYWALGHVHTRETPERDPVVHYPGNTQGLHRKETGARGATLVEVGENGSVELSPIWTDRIRWHRRRTSIGDLETIDDLLGTFGEIAGELAGSAPDRRHMVVWSLTGRGPLHPVLRRPDVVPDLVERLRGEHGGEEGTGRVWLESLQVKTRPQREMAALRERQDLLGDILRLAHEVRRNPPADPDREVGTLAAAEEESEICVELRDSLRTLFDEREIWTALGESPWSTVDWAELIRRAEALAIEGLDEGVDEG